MTSKVIVPALVFCLAAAYATGAPAPGRPGDVTGRVFFVAPGGDAAGDGAENAPFRSISRALEAAGPGDLVKAAAGTYREHLVFQESGEPGKPVVLAGERGPAGEWLTVINPGVPAREWEPAPEIGPGVYRARLGFKPDAMTLEGRLLAKIRDNIMSGATTVWGTGRTGDEMLNLPADEKFSFRDIEVDYWDQVGVLYGYREGTTYIRFRDGRDPTGLDLAAAPGDPAILIDNRSHITIRDLRVEGAVTGVLITGPEATGNTVENCFLAHGRTRVSILNGASHNAVRGNRMTLGYYGGSSFGARTGGEDGARHHQTYLVFKHVIGPNGSDDNNVQLRFAGPGNEVSGNLIENGLIGISRYRTDGLRIHGNHVRNMSSIGLLATSGGVDNRWHDNLVENCGINLRLHHYNDGQPRQDFIFRNMFHNPEDAGVLIFVHSLTKPLPPEAEHPEIWIYHNSLSGGAAGMSSGGPPVVQSGGMKGTRVLNNVISCPRWHSSSVDFEQLPGALAAYDHNWLGGTFRRADPVWLGARNTWAIGERMWPPDEAPDYLLPADSSALGTGLDLSRPFTLGEREHEPLPGMEPGYFSGQAPDPGAVQHGRRPPVTR